MVKIKSRTVHISKPITQAVKMMQLETNFPCHWTPNLESISILINSDSIMGGITSFNPPWTLTHVETDAGLKLLNSGNYKGAPLSKIQSIITQYLDKNYKNANFIFTDGARSHDGKVGAAVFIPSLSLKLAYRLSDNISVNTAELDAIFQAISLIIKYGIQRPVILTDSLNAINALSNPAIFCDSTVHVCLDLISNMTTPPVISYIPGHVGIPEHDAVDRLAKEATALPSINRAICPITDDVYERLKDHYRILGPTLVRSGKTGLNYLKLFPNGKPMTEKLMPRK